MASVQRGLAAIFPLQRRRLRKQYTGQRGEANPRKTVFAHCKAPPKTPETRGKGAGTGAPPAAVAVERWTVYLVTAAGHSSTTAGPSNTAHQQHRPGSPGQHRVQRN